MFTAPDASGGVASQPVTLRDVLTRGLSMAIDGELARRYGLGAFNDRIAVNTMGDVRPAAAPTSPPSAVQQAANLLSNPLVLVGGLALAALVVALIVHR